MHNRKGRLARELAGGLCLDELGTALVRPQIFGSNGGTWKTACRFSLLMCYSVDMASKTATSDKRRRTTMVPVTTMEEIPVLSDKERAELTTSLKEAEVHVKAGKAIDYDPKTFKDRLIGIYRGAKL